MPYPHFKTILLVDDNPDDRLLARRELTREFKDITIREATDQAEFDQLLITTDFDLVITDYQLGWSNGIEILKAVKAHKPKCPVVMFTNTGTQEIAVEAMKSGVDDYVVKSPQHLSQAVLGVWKQFQTELKATQLEGQLQTLLTQLSVGIFRATPGGVLLDANPALLKMLRVPDIEAAQHVLLNQLAITVSALPPGNDFDDSGNDFGRSGGVSHIRELTVERAEHPLWLRVVTTPGSVNGEAVIDGLIEDITARKQVDQLRQRLNQDLEAQIQERTQQLEMINQELESFAYAVSHDLRSPIRQIDGFVYLLREQLSSIPLNPKAQHYFSVITQLTLQAGNMIDGLLAFSRTGRLAMKPKLVNMDYMVRQLVEKIDAYLSGRDVRWEIEALPTVQCDTTLIKTVWQNLLDNAIKFTAQQSQSVITVGSQVSDSTVTFFVKDNGIGFPPRKADKIFDMFQQVHTEKQYRGNGIGLASVKRIVVRHQGRVWAESQPEGGSTFYFSLPNLH